MTVITTLALAVAALSTTPLTAHGAPPARRGYGGLFYSSTNRPTARLSGYLTPKRCYGHAIAVGRGHQKLDIWNENRGALKTKVFTLDGRMLAMSDPKCNGGEVWFYSDRSQTVRVMTINRSPDQSADYWGWVTPVR